MLDLDSCQVYLNDLLQSAGNPSDPIARMMIEQLAMAHHAIGCLHVRAATRESLSEVIAYHGVLARLMSEFRKTSMALQGFRGTAGEQTGRREQQTEAGNLPTTDRISGKVSAAAVASDGNELRNKDASKGRDQRAYCA